MEPCYRQEAFVSTVICTFCIAESLEKLHKQLWAPRTAFFIWPPTCFKLPSPVVEIAAQTTQFGNLVAILITIFLPAGEA